MQSRLMTCDDQGQGREAVGKGSAVKTKVVIALIGSQLTVSTSGEVAALMARKANTVRVISFNHTAFSLHGRLCVSASRLTTTVVTSFLEP